jgi:hypothetical protein
MFEGQSQFRKAQNMAALLAIIILIGIILPIPIGAGFADWMNSVNAPVSIDDKYAETDQFDWDGAALETSTGYKPYFYWWNASGNTNKHNVTMDTRALTAAGTSKDDNNVYLMNASYASISDDSEVDWDEGIPYWEVYFNYTAKDAYADNIVRIGIALDSVNTWASGGSNVTKGDSLLSYGDYTDDADEVKTCTVELSAGDVVFYSKTLSYSGDEDGEIEVNFTIETNDLRQAIMNGGAQSYWKLKVRGHDIRPISMDGSSFQAYNVNRLFGRDDGLYLVSMISVICAALGIFLVQPRYSLPIGNTNGTRKRRGY